MLEQLTAAKWECSVFPQELCVHPNEREPDVKEPLPSESWYLCLTQNSGWPDQAELKVMQPYICSDTDNNMLFGWSDKHGNYVDHKERSVHLDPIRVVAWTPWTGGIPE